MFVHEISGEKIPWIVPYQNRPLSLLVHVLLSSESCMYAKEKYEHVGTKC